MPQLVDPHDVILAGENSFLRLSRDRGKSESERSSHWRVLWSPAGAGHVLFLQGALTDGEARVYADNMGLARWLQETIEVHLHAPFADARLAVRDAAFDRTGSAQSTVVERVVSSEDEVVMAWWDFLAPFVLTEPPGYGGRPLGVYTTFFPARGAQLTLNGDPADGGLWFPERHGRQASSACLAWCETWVRPQG
ncbi:MAG: hypothetical protein FJ313_08335 [Gemmatimonadetes bacterium]|nr:hypothetical protein [Gemmatimonadota bacterium]